MSERHTHQGSTMPTDRRTARSISAVTAVEPRPYVYGASVPAARERIRRAYRAWLDAGGFSGERQDGQ